jgi:hypothetical protein
MLKSKVDSLKCLSAKMNLVIDEAMKNRGKGNSGKGNRYSKQWIIDALLIRIKLQAAYKLLSDFGTHTYLPLPTVATLSRQIKSLRPEFGFDTKLCVGLTAKLRDVPKHEKRGILMFDEIKLGKCVDFRRDLGKIVGMVDFGIHTETEHLSEIGDHALVFLFKPFLSGCNR